MYVAPPDTHSKVLYYQFYRKHICTYEVTINDELLNHMAINEIYFYATDSHC